MIIQIGKRRDNVVEIASSNAKWDEMDGFNYDDTISSTTYPGVGIIGNDLLPGQLKRYSLREIKPTKKGR